MDRETGGMMDQLDLLSSTPASRTSDPESSHRAEDAINADGSRGAQQRAVLEAVTKYPGLTSLQLSELAGIDRYVLARRLPELEPVHITKGPIVKYEHNGRQTSGVTWWPKNHQPTGATP